MHWGAADEATCARAIDEILTSTGGARVAAWRALLTAIAPHIEAWARASWVLRRWRLASDDTARAVLVDVLARLAHAEFANLARFRDRRDAELGADPADSQLEAIDRVARLAGDDDAPVVDEPGPAGDAAARPFRAWLLALVGFVIKDHVRQRLGWARGDDAPSRRAVESEAARLSDVGEPGTRPPFTDYVRVRRLLADVEALAATFPAAMRGALAGWLAGDSYAEIAAAHALDDAAAAERLVRAAKARLREHFRGAGLP